MKVGFLLTDEHAGKGGLENVLISIVKGLEARGIESTILMLRAPEQLSFLDEFGNIQVMPDFINRSWADKLPKFLYHQIWKYRFISHSHAFLQQALDQAALDLLIVVNLSKDLLRILPALRHYKKRAPSVPIIAWPHGSLSVLKKEVQQALAQHSDLFDGTLAISQGLAVELRDILHLKNIELIYNPVPVAPLIPRDPTRFIFVGRIADPGKRLKLLLKVMSRLKGAWHLDIVGSSGDDERDREISQYAEQLKIAQHLTFHGWQQDPWKDIDKMGTLLLNSTSEGFGLVLVEAMMRGIPAISSNCPVGPGEIISNDLNGWLFEVDDMPYLQTLLQQIIDGQRKLPAQETIIDSVKKFSEPVVLDHFEATLNKILKAQKSINDQKT